MPLLVAIASGAPWPIGNLVRDMLVVVIFKLFSPRHAGIKTDLGKAGFDIGSYHDRGSGSQSTARLPRIRASGLHTEAGRLD